MKHIQIEFEVPDEFEFTDKKTAQNCSMCPFHYKRGICVHCTLDGHCPKYTLLKQNQEIITWHNYPEEIPKRDCQYLVMTVHNYPAIVGYSPRIEGPIDLNYNKITKWAELPTGGTK